MIICSHNLHTENQTTYKNRETSRQVLDLGPGPSLPGPIPSTAVSFDWEYVGDMFEGKLIVCAK
jgi:hypothetical protein